MYLMPCTVNKKATRGWLPSRVLVAVWLRVLFGYFCLCWFNCFQVFIYGNQFSICHSAKGFPGHVAVRDQLAHSESFNKTLLAPVGNTPCWVRGQVWRDECRMTFFFEDGTARKWLSHKIANAI